MARSAKQVKRQAARRGAVGAGATALGNALARNPMLAGGSTAFVVATAFVAANALWYQPHAHRGAFFATRDYVRPLETPAQVTEPETTFLIERPRTPQPAGDPTVMKVQEILAELKLYDGPLDGLSGPATARAIERYRATVGLPAGVGIDQELLLQLGLLPTTSGINPAPRPTPKEAAPAPAPAVTVAAASSNPKASERVRAIQAGLRAFGNDTVDVDGLIGPKTRTAIRAFQAAQGMAETGEPDDAVYARLRKLGLISG
jgi:Putative peptidoglycan-binding domain-containing protein